MAGDGQMGRTVVHRLRRFRLRAEKEAEVSCQEIGTSVGCVLYDMCALFGLDEDETRLVIGDRAYRAITGEAIPFRLVQEVDHVRQTEVS